MYPSFQPLNPSALVDLYLSRWRWGVEVEHWTYNAYSATRCTGTQGQVDCSGGVVACSNWARGQVGLAPIPCQASWQMARTLHTEPRPKWMVDHFGADPWTGSTTIGWGISRAQANVTPGALKFHGPREGMDGFSAGGHVATKWYLADGHGPGASIEAMGRYAGVGFSTFLDNQDTYYAVPSWLGEYFVANDEPPELLEGDMLTFICPNKPVDPTGQTPHAEFYPAGANPFLPHGGFILHWGASIEGDQGKKSDNDARQRVLVPQGSGRWIGASERFANGKSTGVMVVNQDGKTSGETTFHWS